MLDNQYYGALLSFTTLSTYTITYNANDGDVASVPANQTKVHGEDLTLSSTQPIRTGYNFTNWNTASGGGETTYLSGGTYSANSAATLYAQWSVISYTLTFDLNAVDAVAVDPTALTPSVPYGANGLSSPYKPADPSRSGYSFLGWGLVQNNLDVVTSYSMPASNSTLYAKWSNETTYSVTYVDNLDSEVITVPVDSNLYLAGGTVNISATEPIRTGYTFSGWTTDSGNNSTIYKTDGTSTYTVVASNITFYAKWTIKSYTLTYSGNENTGGTAPAAVVHNYNTSVSISDRNSLEKSGYTFSGWKSNADGTGTTYNVGSNYTFTETQTVYAYWVIKTMTLTYDGNGNTGGTAPSSVLQNYNTDITVSGRNTLEKSGFTFVGWRVNSDGTGTSYPEGSTYTITDTATIYAQWSAEPTYLVTYNDNVSGETIPVPSDSGSYLWRDCNYFNYRTHQNGIHLCRLDDRQWKRWHCL